MRVFLKKSDEYAKILIIVWMKLREIYLESGKDDKVSLNKRVESLRKFCRTIRKRCEKARKLPKLIKFLAKIENECRNGKETIDKLSHVSAIMKMFDLPKPVTNLMDSLGLGNIEDNEFASVINELFEENIDLNKIDDGNVEEGTLVDYINRKYDKTLPEKAYHKNTDEPRTVTFQKHTSNIPEKPKQVSFNQPIQNFNSYPTKNNVLTTPIRNQYHVPTNDLNTPIVQTPQRPTQVYRTKPLLSEVSKRANIPGENQFNVISNENNVTPIVQTPSYVNRNSTFGYPSYNRMVKDTLPSTLRGRW